jgi:hypothetical protein
MYCQQGTRCYQPQKQQLLWLQPAARNSNRDKASQQLRVAAAQGAQQQQQPTLVLDQQHHLVLAAAAATARVGAPVLGTGQQVMTWARKRSML